MVLESLRPTALQTLCTQMSQELMQLDNEIEQYDRALGDDLELSQRQLLEMLRTRRARKAAMLRGRLATLRSARYTEDSHLVAQRVLQVA